MAADKTDFLRYSAWSIKDVITRKLSEDTKFTDQAYEGSNLATMIDLFSYMAQCMLYSLNNAASESMFSDTQFYENMNRLVKLIGYNPKGFIPANAEFTILDELQTADTHDGYFIPRYSAVNTGNVDDDGKPVYYSFKKDFILGQNDFYNYASNGVDFSAYKTVLYNGIWKLYPTIFTADGSNYETFVLDGIESNNETGKHAAHGFIDVYVQRGESDFIQYYGLTDEIFLNTENKYGADGISIYGNTESDLYYSIRLNENKVYEIKFGNNRQSRPLQKNDKLYIFYLDSNATKTDLTLGQVGEQTQIIPATQAAGISPEFLTKILLGSSTASITSQLKTRGVEFVNESLAMMQSYKITNTTVATTPAVEESVDDIREAAPNHFKLGNRLVTKDDYEYYIKNRFADDIIDVKIQNNWQYIATFFAWLYNLGNNGLLIDYGVRSAKDPKYYINESKLLKHDYKYADPADANNVYAWVKKKVDSDVWNDILAEDVLKIKDLTHEVVFIDPINVYFDICAAPLERGVKYFIEDQKFDPNVESYLEVTVSDNALYANSQIKNQINNILLDYFTTKNMQLGQLVDNSKLLGMITSINGVGRVRTVFRSQNPDAYPDRVVDGLAFASWSGNLLDRGDDLQISNSSRKLEDFQFPALYSNSLLSKIKVIKKAIGNSNVIQY